MKIVYLGIPGSNSYSAAKKYFHQKDAEFVGVAKFAELFENITNGSADLALVPIENSLTGTIGENYDLLNKHRVSVVGEVYLSIENLLLSVSQKDLDKAEIIKNIKRVYSHPQPFEQSSEFFAKHPWMEEISLSDTAAAAKYVSELNDPTVAAIANGEAARLYNLNILAHDIADNKDNLTRFFVIAKNEDNSTAADKCSVIFTLPHTPGSLVNALTVLSDSGVNLEKIESRPIHGKIFEYIFYCDFTYSAQHKVEDILNKFKEKTQTLTVLGCYKGGLKNG